MSLREIKKQLEKHANSERAAFFPRFFKAEKGGYSYGDKFIGITVPQQRIIAKTFKDKITLDEIKELLYSEIHEYRLTALFLLIHLFKKEKDLTKKKKFVDFYLKHRKQVNNWDLVDSSAGEILGNYLLKSDEDPKIIFDLAKSKKLWDERIAMVATFSFIKVGQLDLTWQVAEILINHEHDLIHKAVGWMLREAGKKNQQEEEKFLKKHYKKMPRTMLRYAIEKFDEPKRKAYLNGKI